MSDLPEKALEERLKTASLTDQIDLNRLRRQVSFDRLLSRLFREAPYQWALKGGYALELRFRAARSTVDIDLTLQRVETTSGVDTNRSYAKCCRARLTYLSATGSSISSDRLSWI